MSTSKNTVESFGYEIVPEPPRPSASKANAMAPEEADALMTAVSSGEWIQAPGVFESKKLASSASWKLRQRLVRAGRITKPGDIERRIVEAEDGSFTFAIGKKAVKVAKAKK